MRQGRFRRICCSWGCPDFWYTPRISGSDRAEPEAISVAITCRRASGRLLRHPHPKRMPEPRRVRGQRRRVLSPLHARRYRAALENALEISEPRCRIHVANQSLARIWLERESVFANCGWLAFPSTLQIWQRTETVSSCVAIKTMPQAGSPSAFGTPRARLDDKTRTTRRRLQGLVGLIFSGETSSKSVPRPLSVLIRASESARAAKSDSLKT